jgi:ferrous iron transport protein A
VSNRRVALSEVGTETTAVLASIEGGHGFRSRLAALGFTPGTPVRVVQNRGSGPMIVSVRDTRIALGRGEARKIWVSTGIEEP